MDDIGMSDFTFFIISLAAVLIGLQIARFIYKMIGDGGLEGTFLIGFVLFILGFVFNMPYVGKGLMIVGGCLLLIGLIALIGAGFEGEDIAQNVEENEVITDDWTDADEEEYQNIYYDEVNEEIIDKTLEKYYAEGNNAINEFDDIPLTFIIALEKEYKKNHITDKEEIRYKHFPNIYKYSFLKYNDLLYEYLNKWIEIYDIWVAGGGTEDEYNIKKDKLLDDYYQKYKIRYEK